MKFSVAIRFCGALLCGALASAQAGPAEWVRAPAISPDGKSVAFVSGGQVRVVPVIGGRATALTPAQTYSHHPVWSPDGKQLAFASELEGDPDVFVAPVSGGAMRRLTFSSAEEIPTGFSPDGKDVLFNAHRLGDPKGSMFTARWKFNQLYSTPAQGGRDKLILPVTNEQATWNSTGTQLLYAYSTSIDPSARQHRTAGNAGEIWLYDPATRQHKPLIRDNHDARNPVWGVNDKSVLYLSDRSGSLNVWERDLKTGQDKPLTRYTDQPVRGLSVSKAGDIAFTYGGRLHVLGRSATKPQSVQIDIPEFQNDQPRLFTDTKSSNFAVSPNGKLFALVSRGNVFVMNREGQTFQVTNTPAEERSVTFSPDGGFLVYDSARWLKGPDGKSVMDWRIYKNRLPKNMQDLGQAGAYTETLVNTGAGTAQQPEFSPDGSQVAFVYERREVRVLNVGTGKVVTLYQPSDYHTSYTYGDLKFSWSPDSRHLLVPWRTVPFSVVSRWAIAKSDGSLPLRPLSERLTQTGNATWSPDGTQMLLATPRDALRQLDDSALSTHLYRIYISDEARADFLNYAEAATESPSTAGKVAGKAQSDKENDHAEGEADTEAADLPHYTFQTPRSAKLEGVLNDETADWYAVMPDGLSVLTVSAGEQQLYLSQIDLLTGESEDLGSLEGDFGSEANYQLSADGETLYALTDGKLHLIKLSDLGESKTKSFELTQRQTPSAMRQAAFDAFWLDVKQTFYDPKLHGVNWNDVYSTYSKYLSDVANPTELAELVNEVSGTLNASHLFPDALKLKFNLDNSNDTASASLGLFSDHSYSGAGVKVAAILQGGPLDRGEVKVGDIISAVDGNAIPEVGGLDLLLDGKVGQKVTLTLKRGNETKTLSVKTISLHEEWQLDMARIIEQRRQQVAQQSGGKLAYTYLPEMDNKAFIAAYNDLLTMQEDRQAAIVDVRSNGGGDLNRQLMNFLSGKVFAQFGREGRPWAQDPSNRWRKPSALLLDSFAYSDGSVFPQSYADAKLGPIIGEMNVNTGTGINVVDSPLVPELRYSVPIMPMRRMDGSYYENALIKPDILLPHDPNAEQQGRDIVLEKAIQTLLGK